MDTVRRVTEKSQRKARELAFREIASSLRSSQRQQASLSASSQAISRTSSPPYPSLRAPRGNLLKISPAYPHVLRFSCSILHFLSVTSGLSSVPLCETVPHSLLRPLTLLPLLLLINLRNKAPISLCTGLCIHRIFLRFKLFCQPRDKNQANPFTL